MNKWTPNTVDGSFCSFLNSTKQGPWFDLELRCSHIGYLLVQPPSRNMPVIGQTTPLGANVSMASCDGLGSCSLYNQDKAFTEDKWINTVNTPDFHPLQICNEKKKKVLQVIINMMITNSGHASQSTWHCSTLWSQHVKTPVPCHFLSSKRSGKRDAYEWMANASAEIIR